MTAQLGLLACDPAAPDFTSLGLVTDGDAAAFAVFSPCRRYRYLLGRTWEASKPRMTFLMLNPSTADALKLDPTVTRCVGFARREGCGGLLVVNLAAQRSTDPKGLRDPGDIVGPDNSRLVRWALEREARFRVAAWGRIEAKVRKRLVDSVDVARTMPLFCLGVTETEPYEPRHPLMLRSDTALRRWP